MAGLYFAGEILDTDALTEATTANCLLHRLFEREQRRRERSGRKNNKE